MADAAAKHDVVLEARDVTKRYGGNVAVKSVTFPVRAGAVNVLIGENGAGKSTLMRMLSGEEAPDSGTRTMGHQVVVEYFAQDEAARLDPALTVYETLEAGSPNDMVPAIRNILGGFLFSGDDVYKKAAVLSGGERTRLAVARMLLRPSNTLLMDEPTNHLDLDSKDVLLDALEDYGGTLIIVSHDRYFVEKLATKIIEIGHGEAVVYPGTYSEFLWSKSQAAARGSALAARDTAAGARKPPAGSSSATPSAQGAPAGGRDTGQSRGTRPPSPESRPPRAGHRVPSPGPAAPPADSRDEGFIHRQRRIEARRFVLGEVLRHHLVADGPRTAVGCLFS